MAQQHTFFSLEQVIDRHPLTVSPTTPLHEVISLMHEWGNSCAVEDLENITPQDDTAYRNNSCVLITQDNRLQGIFTERDLVKLVARRTDTQNVSVGEVAVCEVITLTLKSDTDIFNALSLFRAHRIRHLPIVDRKNNLIGLVTAKNLRQKLQPINLMKWREASEVMSREIVYTSPDDSVRNVAILMAERDISCVAICEAEPKPGKSSDDGIDNCQRPVGIITERDIVQYQNLNIDLEQPARNLMSAPLFLVDPHDSLWSVYQQMKQRRVRRLLVADKKGLKGIITQTSLLQIFDPSEMYGVIEVLQRQVCELESQREKLLQEQNQILEREVVERTIDLHDKNQQLKRDRLELKKAHQELSYHVNNSPLAVVEWDRDFRIQRWSSRAEQIFGWQESEVLGKHWQDWQFVLEEDAEDVLKVTTNLLDGSELRNASYNRNYTKDGSIIDCEWYNSVLLDESGNMISILSLAQDDTERQNALRGRALVQEELKTSLRQQQTVAQLGQFALAIGDFDAICDRAVELVITTLNVEYCQILELMPDGKELLLKAGRGWRAGLVGSAKIEADNNTPAGYTLLQSQPVVVDNFALEFEGSSLLLEHRVVSGVSVIIPNVEQPYGILGVYTARHRLFTQDEVNFIQAIANIIAQANERHRAEAALKESQERYELAVEGSSNAIWDWNILTNQVFCAPRWKEILDCDDLELPQTFEAWSNRLHPEDRDRVMTAIQNHLEHRFPCNIEYRLQQNSGNYCWVQARGQAIWDERGRAVRMAGSVADISDRKRRERILKDIASGVSVEAGDNFFHSLVEFLSKTLEVNLAFVSQLTDSEGYQAETLAVYANGKNIDNFVYSLADAPCGNVIDRGLCLYPKAVGESFPNILPLKTVEPESYAGMPIFDADGRVLGLIAVIDSKPFSDIALVEEVVRIFATRASSELERQQAESTLLQSEQKFRAIFDRSFQFIGLLEPDGKVIEANRTALDFVGLTSEDVRGELFWQTPWWSGSLEAQTLLQQGINRAAQGEFIRFEVEHPGTENRVVTVDFSLTPIKDETGKVIMLIPEGRNISDRKQAEADLARSNQILQAISSIQTQYLIDAEPRHLFDGMLAHLLELTESEYGFIGEIHFAADGSPKMEQGYLKVRGRPYLKTHAITNIAWNEETRAFYAENAPKGMEFHNLETLFGAVMVTGKPVIANSPSTDPRSGGIPEGHPELNAFLGIPFYKNDKMTGMVGIANRSGGYDRAMVHYLQPFLDTCSRIIEAYRGDLQREKAEAKIRQQAALLDLTHDTVLVRNLDNRITFWNQGAVEMYGWSTAEAVGQNCHRLLTANFSQPITEIEADLFLHERWSGELTHQKKDGTKVIVMGRWSLLKDAAGNPQQILEINHDITQRKRAEEKMSEQAALLEIATDAIMVRDLNNKILFWSRGAENLYGWLKTEALNRDANKLLYRAASSELKTIQQTVREQGEWQGELNQLTKAGSTIVVESRWTLVQDEAGNPRSYLVVNTDITEQKQLEAQFLRTQRLESLGTLAGGIAHDLNNILAPILGFSKLLPLKLPNVDEQTKGFFKIIENNANRGSALVKQILTFSRGLEGDKGIVQVRHLIAEIAQIINETFPKSIELVINAPKSLWTVNADVNQLHQVLMNLAVNARDAMPNGGQLTIDAQNIVLDAEYVRLHLDAKEGSYILITVSDTGMGIPPEIIDRVFEPFFTTKEVSRGTGLGLSTVIGIVKGHDGFVEVISDRDRATHGTQFKVFLPASDLAEHNLEEVEEILHGNGELVLVVDDESAILEVTKATLETYDYEVVTANNGIDAIATYARQKQDIETVIMDIMMPAMDGKTAIRTLKKINPKVKIIAVSGLIERQEIVAELHDDVVAFLNKPYSNDDLLKVLRKVVSD